MFDIISLFDGLSAGHLAAIDAGIDIGNYYASEIDKPAISVTQYNFPDTIQIGDVRNVTPKIFREGKKILIGGSPCQDISNLSTSKEGLNGEKSSLFYEYLRIKNELNPDYFLLENVSGNKEAIKRITKEMGCRPLRLNSNLVSAQNRNRLYWTNIPVTSIPKDEKIYLQDILESNVDERYFLKDGHLKWLMSASGQRSRQKRFVGIDTQKAGCLTRRSYASWNETYVTDKGRIRQLTPIECERLQTLPDRYTEIAKDKDRYEMIGNCWTVKIISHIFKHIPKII